MSADFINSPTRTEPERIFIALSNAEGALDMLASTVERFELMFVPFARLAAERIRGNDDDNNEAFGIGTSRFAEGCEIFKLLILKRKFWQLHKNPSGAAMLH